MKSPSEFKSQVAPLMTEKFCHCEQVVNPYKTTFGEAQICFLIRVSMKGILDILRHNEELLRQCIFTEIFLFIMCRSVSGDQSDNPIYGW